MVRQKKGWAVWHLKKGLDRRFRSGHPWVYSNELRESPKGIQPGDSVELQDAAGRFLAYGMGNPQSLIAFRALTRNPEVKDPFSPAHWSEVLVRAARMRESLGLGTVSHRLCFGEADGIPGLIVDRYIAADGQVLVVQAHSAGVDRAVPDLVELLREYFRKTAPPESWERVAVVLRNDIGVRKLEGLDVQEPRILKAVPGMDLSQVEIRVKAAVEGEPLIFRVDLVQGQKTGFFLDQFSNIELAALRLKDSFPSKVRILDLCCYVGHWGAQLGRFISKTGRTSEVTAVDRSQPALEFARSNIERQGTTCNTVRADILTDLGQFPEKSFDLVVSDPPALIKSRKDIPVGKHGYLQLLTQVFRLVKPGGAVVCCSCSALLSEDAFAEVLAKASQRNQRQVQWLARGTQSPDHPILAEFPEGRYLKAWVGVVSH